MTLRCKQPKQPPIIDMLCPYFLLFNRLMVKHYSISPLYVFWNNIFYNHNVCFRFWRTPGVIYKQLTLGTHISAHLFVCSHSLFLSNCRVTQQESLNMSDDKPFQCTAPGCGQVSHLCYHKWHYVAVFQITLCSDLHKYRTHRTLQMATSLYFVQRPRNHSVLLHLDWNTALPKVICASLSLWVKT